MTDDGAREAFTMQSGGSMPDRIGPDHLRKEYNEYLERHPYDQDADPLLAEYNEMYARTEGMLRRIFEDDDEPGMELRPYVGRYLDWLGNWIADLGWRRRR